MKKLIGILLCGAMLISMAACTQNGEGESSKPESKQESSTSENSTSQPETSEVNMPEMVLGKITSIAGNEIELSVAKSPYDDANEQPKNEAPKDNNDEEKVAVTMTEAITAGEVDEEYVAPKLELEYTGEKKNFVVPAGAKITGTTGKDEKISTLKKGSVIMLMVDTETNSVS